MTARRWLSRCDALLGPAWDLEARRPGFWKTLALCLAAGFTLWQYFALLDSAATGRTMEYIKRYEEGRVADARRDISRKLRPYIPAFNRLANPDESSRTKIFNAIQETNPEIVDDIDTVVDFFEGLHTCVGEQLCKRSVALGYFGRAEAKRFWQNFSTYIADRRSNNRNYAGGLEWFVNNSRESP